MQAAFFDTSNSTLSRVESTPPKRLPSIGSTTAAGSSAIPETTANTLPQLDSTERQEPVPAAETSDVDEGEDREEKLDKVVKIMEEMHVGESDIHASSQEKKARPEEVEDFADGMTTPPSTPQPVAAKMEPGLSDDKRDLEEVGSKKVPETEMEVTMLDPEQGRTYFMNILLELFNK